MLLIGLILTTIMINLSSCEEEEESEYNLERTLSDEAQFRTLSFDGLSFLTGNLCSDSFIPPGKVADYFGFQYLRDNTPNGQGHNTDFLTFLANNVLNILNDEQIEIIIDRAKLEVDIVNNYAFSRYPLMVAFRRELEGDIPDNSNGLNEYQVIEYSSNKLYHDLDANISINRAFTFSEIIKSLSKQQISSLNDMVMGGFDSWMNISETDRFDKREFNNNNDAFILIMTYCSEMFSWFAGDVESDTYFCPERQANYFGSFYVKDAPAVNNPGYVINEELTADKGDEFAETILNEEQKDKLWNLVKIQRNDLNNIVVARRNISQQLRLYLNDDINDIYDIDVDFIYDESIMYGEYDAKISYHYTMIFTQIMNDLTINQMDEMYKLRGLDDEIYECPNDKIYKYSTKINKPAIENTDFLFIDTQFITTTTTSTPISTSSSSCQFILQFEGGSDSSLFLNELEWFKLNELEVLLDYDYYFISSTYEYYLFAINNCHDSNWWIIVDINNLDKPLCDAAIGRCKRSDIMECDGHWAFKNSVVGGGHTLNKDVQILSMKEICQ